MAQKPSIGRIVVVNTQQMGIENNGGAEAPAVITRVWSDEMVNLRVLADSSNPPEWKTSVALVEDADAAAGRYACWWPPRV